MAGVGAAVAGWAYRGGSGGGGSGWHGKRRRTRWPGRSEEMPSVWIGQEGTHVPAEEVTSCGRVQADKANAAAAARDRW